MMVRYTICVVDERSNTVFLCPLALNTFRSHLLFIKTQKTAMFLFPDPQPAVQQNVHIVSQAIPNVALLRGLSAALNPSAQM